MMAWLLFSTEGAAVQAELQIRANVRAVLLQLMPERIAPDGSGIIGVDAGSGALEPQACLTTAWAVPLEVEEGWVLPVPQPQQIAPIPVVDFLQNVGGQMVDSVTFFPPPEYPSP